MLSLNAKAVELKVTLYYNGNPNCPDLLRARSALGNLEGEVKFELEEEDYISEDVYELAKAVKGSPVLRVKTTYSDGSRKVVFALEPTEEKIREMFAPMLLAAK